MDHSCWSKHLSFLPVLYVVTPNKMNSKLRVYISYCTLVSYTVKKLEVDLTQKRSSQLQSGFIQIQAVAHLLLPGFRVTPLVQWRFLANNELVCK